MNDEVVAYKVFAPDLTCRGFQYEVGKTYTHEGGVELCESGFHAVTVPFDALKYYNRSTTFARVTLSGQIQRNDDGDSKIAAASIRIDCRLSLPQWVKAQAEAVIALCKSAVGAIAETRNTNAAATGNSGHAAATGYSGHAAATGYSGHAAATGNYGHAAATGCSGHAAATGCSGHAAATGNYGHAAATGNYGVAFAGFDGKAKASATGAIAIAWHDGKRARVVSGNVGENGILADTWYRVDDSGNLVKAE